MSTESLPPLSRRAAAAQALWLVALFLGFQLIGGALGRDTQAKFEHPLRSVLLSGTLMLLPVVFFSARDPQWRRSLGLAPGPWLPLLVRGAAGIAVAYALNIIASVSFLLASGGLKQGVAGRAELLGRFDQIPAWSIVPLVVFVGLWEETVFRGFLLGRLRAVFDAPDRPETRLRRDALAVALSGVVFAAGHVYQGALGVLQTLMVGLVFGALTVWSASLWPAIFAHAAIDGFALVVVKLAKPLLERAAKGQLTP